MIVCSNGLSLIIYNKILTKQFTLNPCLSLVHTPFHYFTSTFSYQKYWFQLSLKQELLSVISHILLTLPLVARSPLGPRSRLSQSYLATHMLSVHIHCCVYCQWDHALMSPL